MIWVTSDTHFGHRKIIEYCDRPFDSVADMDESMIANWNAVVGRDDTVFHLGDVSFSSRSRTREILNRLNGRTHLVAGNHDYKRMNDLTPHFETVRDLVQIPFDQMRVVLCHFPIESWNGKYKGWPHLHGHTHGTGANMPGRYDVGVDTWGYTPVSLEKAVAYARGLA